jgi:hypothetical protein
VGRDAFHNISNVQKLSDGERSQIQAEPKRVLRGRAGPHVQVWEECLALVDGECSQENEERGRYREAEDGEEVVDDAEEESGGEGEGEAILAELTRVRRAAVILVLSLFVCVCRWGRATHCRRNEGYVADECGDLSVALLQCDRLCGLVCFESVKENFSFLLSLSLFVSYVVCVGDGGGELYFQSRPE